MTHYRDERLESAIHTAAAEFINRESNRRSLITVMRVTLDARNKHAQIFVSVLPREGAGAALDFLSRQGTAFSAYLKKHLKTRVLPHVEFLADPEMGSMSDSRNM